MQDDNTWTMTDNTISLNGMALAYKAAKEGSPDEFWFVSPCLEAWAARAVNNAILRAPLKLAKTSRRAPRNVECDAATLLALIKEEIENATT